MVYLIINCIWMSFITGTLNRNRPVIIFFSSLSSGFSGFHSIILLMRFLVHMFFNFSNCFCYWAIASLLFKPLKTSQNTIG